MILSQKANSPKCFSTFLMSHSGPLSLIFKGLISHSAVEIMQCNNLSWKATISLKQLISSTSKEGSHSNLCAEMFNVIELKWYYRCSSVGRTLEEFKTSVTVAAHKKITFELTYEELLKRRLGKYELQIHARPMQPVRDFKVSLCWWSYYQPLWSKLAMAFIWMLFSMPGWRAH